MSQRTTRIRWTEEERDTIRRAYRALRAKDATRGVAELFVAAQKQLPPRRRRALNHKLQVWLESEPKNIVAKRRIPPATQLAIASAPIAPPVVLQRTKRAKVPVDKTAGLGSPSGTKIETPPKLCARSESPAAPISAAMAKVMVELGSEIVADILSSARVQQALRALLQVPWPALREGQAPRPAERDRAESPASEDAAPDPAVVVEPAATGKLRVLIAGMPQSEGSALAKTYDDTLEVRSWSAEDGLELLPAAVARANVVVGMTSLLSQPVEQTLRRHAKRYVRNARGVAGLRSELAGLALSGQGVAGEGPR